MAMKLIIRGYSTRLRFAPSPTGFLHLGGLRTALFNFLYAKKTDGKLILRIEDTDQSRTVKGAVSKLIKILDWAGIKFDEGPGTIGGNFGPYTQSERSDIYKNKIGILLEKEKVYRCFCTQERLARIKELSKKASVVNGYDNHCRNLTKEEIEHNLSLGLPYTIRLKIPQGVTNFKDAAKGIISFSNSKIDDCILMKSDGLPTYHFANIVDDHLMGITHVLRGDEWISSSPKHYLLYEAFGWKPPQFCHLPLLCNKDGSKLSKRNLDAHVEYYKDEGFIPSALINFVAFLGWGPGTTKEFYSMKELITDFSLENVNASTSIVTNEKLLHLNKLHINSILDSQLDNQERAEYLKSIHNLITEAFKDSVDEWGKEKLNDKIYYEEVIDAIKGRIRLTKEFVNYTKPFFLRQNLNSVTVTEELIQTFKPLNSLLMTIDEKNFNETDLKSKLKSSPLKFSAVAKCLRKVITCSDVGIDICKTLEILGKSETLLRFKLFNLKIISQL